VLSVKYKLGFYIPEDGNLQSHRRETHRSYRKGYSLPTKRIAAIF
jgi:hypothetical protein